MILIIMIKCQIYLSKELKPYETGIDLQLFYLGRPRPSSSKIFLFVQHESPILEDEDEFDGRGRLHNPII